MRRAWRTKAMGITSIVSAETRGGAISITVRSAHDAGYDSVKWTEVKAVRAPEHDAWAEVDETRRCWGERYLPLNENFLMRGQA